MGEMNHAIDKAINEYEATLARIRALHDYRKPEVEMPEFFNDLFSKMHKAGGDSEGSAKTAEPR